MMNKDLGMVHSVLEGACFRQGSKVFERTHKVLNGIFFSNENISDYASFNDICPFFSG
jgi:hypothetical protein